MDAIGQTRHWVQSVVVGLNFCPFANRELAKNRVRFVANSANLTNTNLTNATFTQGWLTYATMSGTNFTGTNLSGTNISNASLTTVNFTNANLTSANLTATSLTNITWNNTTCIDGTDSDLHLAGSCLNPMDHDRDGLANATDLDDDGDGTPDYIDIAPLDASNNSEIPLQTDGNYKGTTVRDVQAVE